MILIDKFKLNLKKIYNGFKNIILSPAKIIDLCWQKIFKVIEQEFFFLSLMMIFNFMPYLYLFCLYNQYENAIGGLFKPFSVIIFMGLIINFLHGKLKKCLKYFILSISMILSLMELFIIGKYYTFTTAGIISVIIGTNLHETIEFITMYFSSNVTRRIASTRINVMYMQKAAMCIKRKKFRFLLLQGGDEYFIVFEIEL